MRIAFSLAVKSFQDSQRIANAAYDASQVHEFLELRRRMCMDIIRGDDRRTQAYAQIMACHELGMAYLGSIFWVLANRSVATVANCDVVFCTFDCLCGRDFCMTHTHTCADVHVLA